MLMRQLLYFILLYKLIKEQIPNNAFYKFWYNSVFFSGKKKYLCGNIKLQHPLTSKKRLWWREKMKDVMRCHDKSYVSPQKQIVSIRYFLGRNHVWNRFKSVPFFELSIWLNDNKRNVRLLFELWITSSTKIPKV